MIPPTGSGGFPGGITFFNSQIVGNVNNPGASWTTFNGIGFYPYPNGDGQAIPVSNFANQYYGFIDTGQWFGAHFGFTGGGTPTLTAGCNGAGSSVGGNDVSGTVQGQTATATSCTLQFANGFTAAPRCTFTGLNSPITGVPSITTSGFQVNFASTASYIFNYFCPGN